MAIRQFLPAGLQRLLPFNCNRIAIQFELQCFWYKDMPLPLDPDFRILRWLFLMQLSIYENVKLEHLRVLMTEEEGLHPGVMEAEYFQVRDRRSHLSGGECYSGGNLTESRRLLPATVLDRTLDPKLKNLMPDEPRRSWRTTKK